MDRLWASNRIKLKSDWTVQDFMAGSLKMCLVRIGFLFFFNCGQMSPYLYSISGKYVHWIYYLCDHKASVKMDEYYGMFWALYFSNGRSACYAGAWSITRECAVTWLNIILHNTSQANIENDQAQLRAHNSQKGRKKVDSLHDPVKEAVGWSYFNYTLKITIFVSMWNLGQFRIKEYIVNNHLIIKLESKKPFAHMWHI